VDHLDDVRGGEQVARGVVGVGEEDHRGLLLFDGLDHGGHVQTEIVGVQGDAGVFHAAEGGDHAVHDEAGLHRQKGAPGSGQSHGDHLDDLVGAVAQQQIHPLGDRHRLPQA
jgi:hypothetical protein